jgi:hypothetical protein
MKYQKAVGISGGWVKTQELKNGQRAKIVSETTAQPSSFTDKKGNPKTQDVAKVRFEGQGESVNVSLNRATINALIDAYGDDSIAWQGHYLTCEIEKVRVAGVMRLALYLMPEGYEKVDDENGYAVIQKKAIQQPTPPNGAVVETTNTPVEGEVNVEDIPF